MLGLQREMKLKMTEMPFVQTDTEGRGIFVEHPRVATVSVPGCLK